MFDQTFDLTKSEDKVRLACRLIEPDVRKTPDAHTASRCRFRPRAWTFTRKSETRFRTVVSTDLSSPPLTPDNPTSGGGNGAEIDRTREGEERGEGEVEASGSGLTLWSSQGWAHDQILSLIWRRFTQ